MIIWLPWQVESSIVLDHLAVEPDLSRLQKPSVAPDVSNPSLQINEHLVSAWHVRSLH